MYISQNAEKVIIITDKFYMKTKNEENHQRNIKEYLWDQTRLFSSIVNSSLIYI